MSEKISRIARNVISVQNVILTNTATYHTLVEADVMAVRSLADLEYIADVKRNEISMRPELNGKPEACIKRVWKTETNEVRRLITIAKGHIVTLKSLLYNASR